MFRLARGRYSRIYALVRTFNEYSSPAGRPPSVGTAK